VVTDEWEERRSRSDLCKHALTVFPIANPYEVLGLFGSIGLPSHSEATFLLSGDHCWLICKESAVYTNDAEKMSSDTIIAHIAELPKSYVAVLYEVSPSFRMNAWCDLARSGSSCVLM
jgi:hypothetical protein